MKCDSQSILDCGWWLNWSSRVEVTTTYKARLNSAGNLEFQLLAGSYIWYDEIDAVSFPGINVLKGESQDIFDKTINTRIVRAYEL